LLTDFFVAAPADAAAIASGSFRDPEYSTKNADNSVLAELWSALDETSNSSRLAGEEFLVAMGSKEGPWVFDLPDEMITRLYELPEAEFLRTADRWACSSELSHYNVSGTDKLPSLTILKRLAEQAHSSRRRVLLRMAI
jgi:hypothetical protein